MSELPSQSELDQQPPVRQEQVDDWLVCYTYVSGEVSAYERLAERGELSDIGTAEYEDLQTLQAFYKRLLDTGRAE